MENFWLAKFIFVVSILVLSATAQQFYTGTRYGKRGDTGTKETSKFQSSRNGRGHSQVQLVARNDRFFLGSRYGKRSSACEMLSGKDLPYTIRQLCRGSYGSRTDMQRFPLQESDTSSYPYLYKLE